MPLVPLGRLTGGVLMLTEPVSTETPEPITPSSDSAIGEYIENACRTDGSRTPIWKVARCHQLKRDGRSVNAIAQILGMDNRTVSAVLARQDTLISDARMLLKANALGFVGDLIHASQEAAKRGKTEGIAAVLDRLDVTQPPKSQAQTNVGVQVVLHGGPEPVSLAKVAVQSEGRSEQAQSEAGLIRPVMLTADTPQVIASTGTYSPHVNITASVVSETQEPAV